jgi:hypothetical protein
MSSREKHPEDRRAAAQLWLANTIRDAIKQGQSNEIAPALDLLGALEGLDFGKVDPMLRLSPSRKAGGVEDAPSEIGVKAMAVAAVDTLISNGMAVETALYMVAEDLGMLAGPLKNLRKKMSVERSKPPAERTAYVSLIECYESEVHRMRGLSKEDVWLLLARAGQVLGVE